MTPRNRILAATALVAVLTIPVGAAVAGRSNTIDIATATGTSLTTTTAVPSTTTEAPPTIAPTTAAPATTEAPTTTEAPPPTVAPTTAAPVAAPPAPTPIATTVAVPTPGGFRTTTPVDAKTAFEYAAALKRAGDEAAAAAAAAANPPASTPAPDPAAPAPADPSPAPAPIPSDDPLQSLSIYDQQFLGCVRWRESRDNYGAVNSSSGAGGAYQFLQNTWNNTAAHLGRGDLIGTRPNYASKYDQDSIAVHLLQWYGRSPWAGPGC